MSEEVVGGGVVVSSIPGQKTLLHNNQVFPLALSPQHKDTFTLEDTKKWVRENKEKIESLLTTHGSIVFRGFPIESPEQFDEVVSGLNYTVFPYEAGNAPRLKVTGNVYTSTELPPQFPLILHHEMCYRTSFPSKLFFFCGVPAQADGETPLCDSNFIYEHLAEHKKEFLEKVATHGARYHKLFHDKNAADAPKTATSWQSAYGTEDPKEVEAATLKLGNTFVWHVDKNNNKTFERITPAIPALRPHPLTHKTSWFNNVHFSHPASWNTTKEYLTSYVTYGNGDEVDPEDAKYVTKLIWDNCIMFKWQAGDIVLVDNGAVLHGRNKYTPPRKVYLIMTH